MIGVASSSSHVRVTPSTRVRAGTAAVVAPYGLSSSTAATSSPVRIAAAAPDSFARAGPGPVRIASDRLRSSAAGPVSITPSAPYRLTRAGPGPVCVASSAPVGLRPVRIASASSRPVGLGAFVITVRPADVAAACAGSAFGWGRGPEWAPCAISERRREERVETETDACAARARKRRSDGRPEV
jgi:hypothetical protein